MPTQNVNLTDHQAEFIRQSVESGDYNNASEVVREALRLLKAYKQEQQAKLELLRAEIQKGMDDLDAGRYIKLNGKDDIANYFEDVKKRGMERLATETNARPLEQTNSSSRDTEGIWDHTAQY